MNNLNCHKCGNEISNEFGVTLVYCTSCGASLKLATGEKTLSLTDSAALYSPAPQPDTVKTSKTSRYLIGGIGLLGTVFLLVIGFSLYGLPRFTKYYTCTIPGEPEPQTAEEYFERAKKHIEIFSEGRATIIDECAFGALNETLRLNPNHSDALRTRGYYYRQEKKYELAEADYDRAVQLEPSNEKNYYLRSFLYKEWGKVDKAIEALTTVINLQLKNNPGDIKELIDDYERRIQLYQEINDYDNLIKDYTELIRLKPNNSFYYSQRAQASENKGDFENAVKDYTEAIRLNPKSSNNYFYRSLIYEKLGKRDLADADKKKGDELRLAEVNETPAETPKTPVGRKIISGGVFNASELGLPQPSYPPAARAVRAGGEVKVQVIIDENGKIVSANAVSGHALLHSAAEAAALLAKFSPIIMNGEPVVAKATIIYNFVPE